MTKICHTFNMRRAFSALLSLVLLASVMIVPVPARAEEDNGFGERTIMVSLGDSYSSGEGIEPFYDQFEALEDKVQSQDWLAHRSMNSWPGMLTLPGVRGTMSQNRNTVWYFAASSGAKTEHLNKKQEDDGKYYSKDNGWFDKLEGQGSILPQLDIFANIPEGETDYVTMSMGGNDADFVGIITKAVVGTAYFNISGLKKTLDKKVEQMNEGGSLRKALYDAYKAVETKAGKQANIIIAGYPRLLDPDGGDTITAKEAQLINSAVTKFNTKIEELVDSCRNDEKMNIYFVDVQDEFDGHGAYSDDPYIKDVMLAQQPEDLKDHDWGSASSYSMHPNYKGACAYARCVQNKINQIEKYKTQYKTTFDLSVNDYQGKPCSDYSVKIEGKTAGFIFGLFSKEYHAAFDVDSAAPYTVKVPKGEYTVTVMCNGEIYSSQIVVTANGKKDKLVINTNIGFDPTWGGEIGDWYDKPNRVTSDERDVVLVLDVSGSMDGRPMEETIKASENFIDTVLQQDASIGIVTYESYANQTSDFSIDGKYLKQCVRNIYASGGTNIDSGISMAHDMLKNSNAKKKIIVLMSDGEPNEGREGQALIDYADEVKKDGITIYTLGFFENLGSYKTSAQMLMEGIASEGCHYEVANADDLVFFFEDMADQINGTKYIYIRIACPVEVSVTFNGETLSSADDSLNQRTEFGTLTFEESENPYGGENDRVKILRLKEGEDYDVQIVGTGRGLMDYTIGFMDEDGEYSDIREFHDVKINKHTVIDTVASTSRSTVLKVDQDGDGDYDVTYRAKENSIAEEDNASTVIWVVVAAVIVVAAAALAVLIVIKKRKRGKIDG